MSEIWGYAIPGLSMAALEIPPFDGLIRGENPGVGNGPSWFDEEYSIRNLAEYHAKIISQAKFKSLTVIGMSMGGMIASVLASEFRRHLPLNTTFRILVSSPNLPNNPAITKRLLSEWKTAKQGNYDDFSRILTPFFSKSYLLTPGNKSKDYFKYRTSGQNNQNTQCLYGQIKAILDYPGEKYWPQVKGSEVMFIGGLQDFILGHSHNEDFKKVVDKAQHYELPDLGHMANIEMPWLFDRYLSL